MIVVSDTSPIRALAQLDELGLLAQLFQKVLIPPAVADELRRPRRNLSWIDPTLIPGVAVTEVKDRAAIERLREWLDPGEAEAIALAVEWQVRTLLIDERDGRRIAQQMGLQPLGVLGLLVRAKRQGRLQRIAPLVDRLQQEIQFRVSPGLQRRILAEAGEA
jgi:predicted nucleic acid-binding protein